MQGITTGATVAATALALALCLGGTAQARKTPAAAAHATVAVLAKDAQGQDIVAYFSAPNEQQNAKPVPQPAAGGFYRVLLGKDAKGCYRIQDHYQDSGKRQAASTTCSAGDLTQWALRHAEGKMTLYRPNGQVRSSGHYQDGRPHGMDRYYDDQGQVRMSTAWVNGEMHGPFRMRDLSGQRQIAGVARYGEVTRIRATDNGQALDRATALELLDEATTTSNWSADMYR